MPGIPQYRINGLLADLETINTLILNTSGDVVSDISDLQNYLVQTSGDNDARLVNLLSYLGSTSGDFDTRITNLSSYIVATSGDFEANKAELNGDITQDFGASHLYGANALNCSGDIVGDRFGFHANVDEGNGSALSLDLNDGNIFTYDKDTDATITVALSNGLDGTYMLIMTNTTGGAVTVDFSGGTISLQGGVGDFTLTTGDTGIYTITKSGTTHYITQTLF